MDTLSEKQEGGKPRPPFRRILPSGILPFI